MASETIRVASYNVELHRKGPGLMLRDVLRGDAQARAAAQVIAFARPDIIALQSLDYDTDLHGIRAFRDLITEQGHELPHIFALAPNTGVSSGVDLSGDGRTDGPNDAQGFGFFPGQRGMALLSRFPFEKTQTVNLSTLLWRDLPQAQIPNIDGKPFPSQSAVEVQRLSSVGHWMVPVTMPNKALLWLMTFNATPPVFDGPEDRNGLRNADEIRLWQRLLDGDLELTAPEQFVILGDANLDPADGEGRHDAIRSLIHHELVADPAPESATKGTDTVDWSDPVPGDLRVDYVLPSANLSVMKAGVVWPETGPMADHVTLASRHRLVWVDIAP